MAWNRIGEEKLVKGSQKREASGFERLKAEIRNLDRS